MFYASMSLVVKTYIPPYTSLQIFLLPLPTHVSFFLSLLFAGETHPSSPSLSQALVRILKAEENIV